MSGFLLTRFYNTEFWGCLFEEIQIFGSWFRHHGYSLFWFCFLRFFYSGLVFWHLLNSGSEVRAFTIWVWSALSSDFQTNYWFWSPLLHSYSVLIFCTFTTCFWGGRGFKSAWPPTAIGRLNKFTGGWEIGRIFDYGSVTVQPACQKIKIRSLHSSILYVYGAIYHKLYCIHEIVIKRFPNKVAKREYEPM